MPILFLCCAKSLNAQLEEMNIAGKKSKNAAEQCLEILDAIRTKGPSAQFLQLKRTRNGEARVEKCIKYDLGNGYRLITIRCRDCLFIPFVGTHDKADLWFEHNRLDYVYDKRALYDMERIADGQHETIDVAETPEQCLRNDEYEEDLFRRIDDTILRQVFKGLMGQR